MIEISKHWPALESLGYTGSESRAALKAVEDRSSMTVEERVIAALREMDDGN